MVIRGYYGVFSDGLIELADMQVCIQFDSHGRVHNIDGNEVRQRERWYCFCKIPVHSC